MNDSYKHPLWQRKRLEILSRDNWECVACSDKNSTLHVHHLMYDGEPWQVSDKYLQTLCESCHEYFGPHPKGGVHWARLDDAPDPVVVICWCPHCSSTEFKDKGTYVKCSKCSWRSDIYGSQAIFPSHPASDAVFGMCECAKRFEELRLSGSFSEQDELDAVADLIKCRREIENLFAVGYGKQIREIFDLEIAKVAVAWSSVMC